MKQKLFKKILMTTLTTFILILIGAYLFVTKSTIGEFFLYAGLINTVLLVVLLAIYFSCRRKPTNQ